MVYLRTRAHPPAVTHAKGVLLLAGNPVDLEREIRRPFRDDAKPAWRCGGSRRDAKRFAPSRVRGRAICPGDDPASLMLLRR
jgi:hypothetical protein